MATMLTPITAVIKFKSWCWIDQANPTVTQGLNGTSLSAKSDLDSSYDGTSLGRKILINFERQITLPIATYPSVVVIGEGNTTANTNFSYSGPSNLPSGRSLATTCRLSLITAAFVTASQNWNNKGSLTLGTQYTFSAAQGQWNTAGSGSATLINMPVLLSANEGQNIKPIGYRLPNTPAISLYGVMVEIKGVNTGDAAYSITSTLAILTASLGASNSIKEPFIVPASLY